MGDLCLQDIFTAISKSNFLVFPPSNKMAFLRFGEFHKMDNGKIIETYVYLGLAELIIEHAISCRRSRPLAIERSYSGKEGVVPGPATHDGILITVRAILKPLVKAQIWLKGC